MADLIATEILKKCRIRIAGEDHCSIAWDIVWNAIHYLETGKLPEYRFTPKVFASEDEVFEDGTPVEVYEQYVGGE